MKKIVFLFVFVFLIQSLAFAEGEEVTEIAEPVEAAEAVENAEADTRIVDLYVFGNHITLSSAPIFTGDTLMLPIKEFLAHHGECEYYINAEKQVTITHADKIVVLHPDTVNAELNYEAVELPAAPFFAGDVFYVPAETVCRALGLSYKYDIYLNVMSVFTDFAENEPYSERRVCDLSSDTQYLIWVNKQEFTVHVFLGRTGAWREVYSCKCAIGAPYSPTVTGVFKYFSPESRWSYKEFYVGPIMRFYRGYAIHSTLLRYDGGDYNDAVGVKISHGCVRVRPDDINWLVSYVPVNTTVYVSEN